MRVVKDPVVRRNELLDAAEHLFTTKGYQNTSIADIVRQVQVAKGTFYYYFKSKEEILDEVLLRLIQEDVRRMRPVLEDASLPPVRKLTMLLLAQNPQEGDRKDRMTEEFHQPGNAEMHQRGTQLAIQHLAPILAGAVREGIDQGVFSTDTPLEDMEMLLATSTVLFDEGLVRIEPEDLPRRIVAFFGYMERVLGAQPGTFDEMRDALMGM